MRIATSDLRLDRLFVVYPGSERYPLSHGVEAVPVTELADDDPAQVLVRLAAGDEPLLARVTRRSQRLLDIRPGRRLFAQVKGVALGA